MSELMRPAEPRRDIAALTTAWEKVGLDARTLAEGEGGTLGASDRKLLSAGLSVRPERMPATLLAEPLEVRSLLGEGGMGEVHLAYQEALRREVAMKIPRSERGGATEALLKEAWVGALVEHPNVVPVHALVRSPADAEAPAMLMTRIAGRPWSQVLADGAAAPELGASEALEWHLRVLLRVCHAVAFAHSRGVLHLDLKPDNVMVGPNGEAYVLDWGLAVAHGTAAPGWLARAADVRRVAGTPGYMAPELAAADGAHIDERTDVYLLGAMLHHVLTGGPLHRGDSLLALLGAAFASVPPAYGPDVPSELAAIAIRATAFDPERRPPTATALRESIEAFLAHRPAERLVARVRDQLAAIRAAESGGDEIIEPALAEADLALEEVRRIWADHPALAGLDAAVAERSLEHAILRQRPGAARALVPRLAPEARADADAKIAALEARLHEHDRHVRALEELERDLDLALGTAARTRLWTALGTVWCILSCVFGALERSGVVEISYASLLLWGGVMMTFFVPYAWLNRKTHFTNRAHRRLYGGLVLTAGAVELVWLVGWTRDVPVRTAIAITSLLYVYAFAMLGVALDRRLLPAAGVLLATSALIGLVPEMVHEWLGLGGLMATLATARAWSRPTTPRPA